MLFLTIYVSQFLSFLFIFLFKLYQRTSEQTCEVYIAMFLGVISDLIVFFIVKKFLNFKGHMIALLMICKIFNVTLKFF